MPSFLYSQPPIPNFNVNAPIDDEGHTPLHWASSLAMLEVVQLLLGHGADPYILNHNGVNCLGKLVCFGNAFDNQTFPGILTSYTINNQQMGFSLVAPDGKGRSVVHWIIDYLARELQLGSAKIQSLRYYLFQSLQYLHNINKLNYLNSIRDFNGDTIWSLATKLGLDPILRTTLSQFNYLHHEHRPPPTTAATTTTIAATTTPTTTTGATPITVPISITVPTTAMMQSPPPSQEMAELTRLSRMMDDVPIISTPIKNEPQMMETPNIELTHEILSANAPPPAIDTTVSSNDQTMNNQLSSPTQTSLYKPTTSSLIEDMKNFPVQFSAITSQMLHSLDSKIDDISYLQSSIAKMESAITTQDHKIANIKNSLPSDPKTIEDKVNELTRNLWNLLERDQALNVAKLVNLYETAIDDPNMIAKFGIENSEQHLNGVTEKSDDANGSAGDDTIPSTPVDDDNTVAINIDDTTVNGTLSQPPVLNENSILNDVKMEDEKNKTSTNLKLENYQHSNAIQKAIELSLLQLKRHYLLSSIVDLETSSVEKVGVYHKLIAELCGVDKVDEEMLDGIEMFLK